jgi:PHD/YefM family antitoxin component YafN of YafNO toxin-antitoxin module
MVRTISKQEAEGAFGELLGTLSRDKETVIVEEGGEPVAVVISPDEFHNLNYDRFWSTVDRIRERNADLDPDTVLAEITKLVDEVRQERHGQSRAAN